MIEKPEQYYDTRRHQLYYQWRESEYFSHQEPIYDRMREYIESLEAENAKLRNLAHILCHCMQIHAECDDCRLNGAKGELAFDPLCACDGLHELLREVGIEVK